MELRFHYNDDIIASLQQYARADRASDVARDGLNFLNWAMHEVKAGRDVVSVDKDGITRVPIVSTLEAARTYREVNGA